GKGEPLPLNRSRKPEVPAPPKSGFTARSDQSAPAPHSITDGLPEDRRAQEANHQQDSYHGLYQTEVRRVRSHDHAVTMPAKERSKRTTHPNITLLLRSLHRR